MGKVVSVDHFEDQFISDASEPLGLPFDEEANFFHPEEVHDGTFTITNPGQFGSQFGMPIINQPQVAILGIGTIEKRPIVIDDAIAIRTMAYLTLGYDHRLVDGATGDQFMADIKQQIEHFDGVQD